MVKIVAWRFIYHFLCFFKKIGFRGSRSYYFAYGGNLDPEVLKRRNIEPLTKREFTLVDYEIKFNHEIPFKGAAMASIEPCRGGFVPGVIYEIYKIDELRLDCMESNIVFKRYLKKTFQAERYGSIFFYQSNCRKEGLLPTKGYLEKILNGYRVAELMPEDFLLKLSKTPTVEGFQPKVPPHFLIKNYSVFGRMLSHILIKYDCFCVKIFAALIFKPSVFERTKN